MAPSSLVPWPVHARAMAITSDSANVALPMVKSSMSSRAKFSLGDAATFSSLSR